MKGANVIAVTIGMVLVVITLLVSSTLLTQQKNIQKLIINETIFNLYCSNITLKYKCDIKKMKEQELNNFLKICQWEFGNESIDPEKCVEKCGCSGIALEGLNIFKKYTGIDCERTYCHATQHGLYAHILKLINNNIVKKGDKVFYIDSAGRYHDCFLIDTNEGFFIRFTDEASYNCGDSCTLSEEPPDDTPGTKKVDFVSDKRNNKVYLKGIQGFVWNCENCANSKFPIENEPVRVEIKDIEKPTLLGGVGKFSFKIKPCVYLRPFPFVDIEVYLWRKYRYGKIKEIRLKSGILEIGNLKYNFKVVLNYENNYFSEGAEEGKATVYAAIIVPNKDKEYFDFSNIKLSKAQYLIGFTDNDKYYYVFKCDLLPGENCSATFPEKIPKGKKTSLDIKVWGYSFLTTTCANKIERNYTIPHTNICKHDCYFSPGSMNPDQRIELLKNDIVRIVNKCDTSLFYLSKIIKKYYSKRIINR